jgi:SNF2 family DNA or RNA helicase
VEPSVLLISLKVGGTGLNLTSAEVVFLLDPWWNPAVEAQAIARAHRIGQKRKVHAIRLVSDGTIEERILRLQDKKRDLADSILEAAPQALDGLTGADIQALLGA